MLRRLGNYELIREIGRGAMGVVYEGRQRGLDRRVAVKILHPSFTDDLRRVARFRHEAELAAGLHHPALVPVYEFGEDDGTYFYSMELVDGAPLDKLIRFLHDHPSETTEGRAISTVLEIASKAGPPTDDKAQTVESHTMDSAAAFAEQPSLPVRLPADESYVRSVVAIAADVAEALHVAHTEKGIVHRDVKPSNLMLDRHGHVRVLDFGIAMDREVLTLTRHDEAIGTLPYMSPEQLVGSRLADLDARSDVYSLGATLYELLVFEPPFTGRSQGELERRIKWSMPASLRAKRRGISRDLEIIVLHALRKNPEDRYATALDFAKDLRGFLVHEAPLAAPIGRVDRVALWYRRNLVPATAAAVLLVAGAATAGVSMRHAANEREQRHDEAVDFIEKAKQLIPSDIEKPWATADVISFATTAQKLVPEDPALQEQCNFLLKLARDRQSGLQDRETANQVADARRRLADALPRAYFLDLVVKYLNEAIDAKRAQQDLDEALHMATKANDVLLRLAPEQASFEPLFLSARRRKNDDRESIVAALADLDAAEKVAAGARQSGIKGILEMKARLYELLNDSRNATAIRTRMASLVTEPTDLDYSIAGFAKLPQRVTASKDLEASLLDFNRALELNLSQPAALCGRGLASFKKAGALAAENGSHEEYQLCCFVAVRDISSYAALDRSTEYPDELLGAITYYFNTSHCNNFAEQDYFNAAKIADGRGSKTATMEYYFGVLYLDPSWQRNSQEDVERRRISARQCFQKGLEIDPKNEWCIAGMGGVEMIHITLETFPRVTQQFRAFLYDSTSKTRLELVLERNRASWGKGPEEHRHLALLAIFRRATGETAEAIELLKAARASCIANTDPTNPKSAAPVTDIYDQVIAEWSEGT
ncbi:MAG: serine/threonine protein kinase [Planctomycetes bacterium]|nr:serine/threonine protein kinase [Planctomycetota bacterium]